MRINCKRRTTHIRPDENGKFYKRLRERFLEHFES